MSKFKFVGLKEGMNDILEKRLEENLEKNVKRILNRSALLVEGTAKESIQRGAKTGKVYKRGSITHQASAPGQPPASDTGFLVSNITHKTVLKRGKGFEVSVVSSAPYSDYLEFGTRNMEARPFLQPALETNSDKIQDIFVKQGLIK